MRRINDSKTGFTILELIAVIAIIVIISCVMYIGLVYRVKSADKTAATVSAHNSKTENAQDQVDNLAP